MLAEAARLLTRHASELSTHAAEMGEAARRLGQLSVLAERGGKGAKVKDGNDKEGMSDTAADLVASRPRTANVGTQTDQTTVPAPAPTPAPAAAHAAPRMPSHPTLADMVVHGIALMAAGVQDVVSSPQNGANSSNGNGTNGHTPIGLSQDKAVDDNHSDTASAHDGTSPGSPDSPDSPGSPGAATSDEWVITGEAERSGSTRREVVRREPCRPQHVAAPHVAEPLPAPPATLESLQGAAPGGQRAAPTPSTAAPSSFQLDDKRHDKNRGKDKDCEKDKDKERETEGPGLLRRISRRGSRRRQPSAAGSETSAKKRWLGLWKHS
jgi:hypothetical protein